MMVSRMKMNEIGGCDAPTSQNLSPDHHGLQTVQLDEADLCM